MLFNIYSHLLAFTRIYSHSKLIITARTKFPRGFLHIELKVILDLDTIVCLIRTLLYGESEIHAIQCQEHMECASWSASGDQVHLHEAAPTAGPRHWHLLLHRAPGRGVVTIPDKPEGT